MTENTPLLPETGATTQAKGVLTRRTLLSLGALAPLAAVVGSASVRQGAAARIAPVALGAWAAGGPWDGGNLERYVSLTESKPTVHTWYQDWAHGGFDPIPVENIRFRNATPILTWMPEDYTMQGRPQPAYSLAAITRGDHDVYIRRFANDVAGWGKLLYIRFAHEMNDNAYPWAIGTNGNTPAQYVPMWQHVVDIFNDVGVENVRWVWCPNITYHGASDFTPLYPGHNYVQVLGLDAYNYGTMHAWSRWKSFATLFQQSYHKINDISEEKPLIIGEMGSVEQGGNKADWIRQTFFHELPEWFPRVRAAIWFNENRAPREGDWRVDTSARSLEAFRAVAQLPYYGGRFPT